MHRQRNRLANRLIEAHGGLSPAKGLSLQASVAESSVTLPPAKVGKYRVGVLLVKCSTTGEAFSTGILVESSTISTSPVASEASLADAISPSDWIENQESMEPLRGRLTVPSFAPRMVCTKRGMTGADVPSDDALPKQIVRATLPPLPPNASPRLPVAYRALQKAYRAKDGYLKGASDRQLADAATRYSGQRVTPDTIRRLLGKKEITPHRSGPSRTGSRRRTRRARR